MKLAALALFAFSLAAQQVTSTQEPINIYDIGPTVTTLAEGGSEICILRAGSSIWEVSPGALGRELCWRGIVKAHNRSMNDLRSHQEMDRLLQMAARQFGKAIVPCVRQASSAKWPDFSWGKR